MYTGLLSKYELKGGILLPATKYFFRLQASNLNGASAFSQCVECLTPAAVPSMIASVKIEDIKSDLIHVSWKQPSCNGDQVTFYNIDIGNSAPITVYSEKLNCEYKLTMLQPDTIYKLRVQAANSMGVGPYSSIVKVKTKALVPVAPNLESVSSTYNSVKLKWTHLGHANDSATVGLVVSGTDTQIIYNLEMMLTHDADKSINLNLFASVYEGALNAFKVTKLQESSVYLFRVCATNETGQGEWSDICKVATSKSPPIINKAPHVLELAANACLIEWTPAKFYSSNTLSTSQELLETNLEYILQVQKSPSEKSSEYKEVYRGDACSFKLKDLSANTEYNARVCSVRVLSDLQRIYSPVSPHTSFTTPKNHHHHHKNLSPNNHVKSIESNNGSNASSSNQGSDGENAHGNNMGESGFLSRFMWPSFYTKLNPDSTATTTTSKKSMSSANVSKANQNLFKRHSINRGDHSASDNSTASQSASSASSSNNNRRGVSDKQWALLLIFVLVIIAFFTAFTFNTVYTSFNAAEVSVSNN